MSAKKLTVAMSTFDDSEGAYWSVQSIRLYHPEVLSETEFLILDNSPDSPHGKVLERFSGWVKDSLRIVPVRDARGTAMRTRLFDLAETPYVLCMDSHVMLAHGSLRQLIDGMDSGRDEGNLLQGPMFYDNLTMASHMAHVWRGGMLGIWAAAWQCPCGYVFQTAERKERDANWLEFQTISLPHTRLERCHWCDAPFPTGVRWEGHERHVAEAGFSPAVDGDPFEIPAHGLGLFACRKDVWPGFNPGFRDFGGEECYIHEKFRQMGKTTVCLPFLRWLHRFERVAGVPYPAPWESRIMNYLIGHAELGWNPQPVLEHFSALLGADVIVRWKGDQPQQVTLKPKRA